MEMKCLCCFLKEQMILITSHCFVSPSRFALEQTALIGLILILHQVLEDLSQLRHTKNHTNNLQTTSTIGFYSISTTTKNYSSVLFG